MDHGIVGIEDENEENAFEDVPDMNNLPVEEQDVQPIDLTADQEDLEGILFDDMFEQDRAEERNYPYGNFFTGTRYTDEEIRDAFRNRGNPDVCQPEGLGWRYTIPGAFNVEWFPEVMLKLNIYAEGCVRVSIRKCQICGNILEPKFRMLCYDLGTGVIQGMACLECGRYAPPDSITFVV